MRENAHRQAVKDLSRAAEKGSQWLWMKRKDSTWAFQVSRWHLGSEPGMLNPLEVSWAYQRNTQGGRPLDNPKGAITHLTIPESHQCLKYALIEGYQHPVLHNKCLEVCLTS